MNEHQSLAKLIHVDSLLRQVILDALNRSDDAKAIAVEAVEALFAAATRYDELAKGADKP